MCVAVLRKPIPKFYNEDSVFGQENFHLTGNAAAPFVCDGCGRSYKYKYNLSYHRRIECGKEPQVKCPYCDYRCHHKRTLKPHIHAKHFSMLNQLRFSVV